MLSNKIYIIKHANEYYYFMNDEFYLTVYWFHEKTGLEKEYIKNALVNVYNGEYVSYRVRFSDRKDACAALEWLESLILIRKLGGIPN